jgi:hypothetical protein
MTCEFRCEAILTRLHMSSTRLKATPGTRLESPEVALREVRVVEYLNVVKEVGRSC